MNGTPQAAPQMPQTPGQSIPPAPQKRSNAWKWLAGCGCGCLIIIALVMGASFFGVKKVVDKIKEAAEKVTAEFVDQGYKRVGTGTGIGQVIEVTEDVSEKTVYIAQVVKIMGTCHDDIAIVAQQAEIHGTVEGNVSFFGQVLVVQPSAVIKKNLDSKFAQVIQVYGSVEGQITGNYQQLQDSRQGQTQPSPETEAPAATDDSSSVGPSEQVGAPEQAEEYSEEESDSME
jgi:hypothetical protein